MNVTAFHTSNGTVNYTFVHCVDKDSLDMLSCPDRYHDDGTRGYFDIKGGETGNYSGEC